MCSSVGCLCPPVLPPSQHSSNPISLAAVVANNYQVLTKKYLQKYSIPFPLNQKKFQNGEIALQYVSLVSWHPFGQSEGKNL